MTTDRPALSESVPPDWQTIVFNTWTKIWWGAPGGLNMNTERLSDRQYLRDFEFSSSCLYHLWTFICFLWHFRPFPGHGLHVFLPPVTPTSLRCESVFFFSFLLVFSNMTTSLLTSSFHPFLGLPAGFLPPQLPSTIRFWILLSNVLTIRSAHFNIFTCMYVARSLNLYSLRCFMFSIAINL